jgi:hypothetical protein
MPDEDEFDPAAALIGDDEDELEDDELEDDDLEDESLDDLREKEEKEFAAGEEDETEV